MFNFAQLIIMREAINRQFRRLLCCDTRNPAALCANSPRQSIPIIAEYEYLIVLDCVDAHDGEIGDVYFFDFENVPNTITWQGSAHEVEMLQTLTMMDMVGDRPPTKVVGIIPEVVDDTTLELTPAVLKGSSVMESVLLKHLVELGFSYQQISDIDIQSVANMSCLEDR